MGEALIVRKGGESVERTAVPSINFISAVTTSLTFTFTNNEAVEVDLYYGLTTPPQTKITLAANTTTSNITFSTLNDTDTFNVYAYAIVIDPTIKKIKSEIAETQAKTLIPTPTITNVSQGVTGIDDASISFTVRNNSRLAGDVIYDLVTPPIETTLQLNANTTSSNQTISGLGDNETFTIFAQTKITGFADSAITSQSVTTPEFKSFIEATGGTTEEYNQSGKRYRSHTFTSSGTFTVTTVGNGDRNVADYLIVAGGGSGSANNSINPGGGGGAGGFRTTNGTSGGNSAAEPKVIVTAQAYSIGVGGGGGNSSAFGITATRGGGGGNGQGSGGSGGSGGGASGSENWSGCSVDRRGPGTAGQGFSGGNGQGGANQNAWRRGAGGGGGAAGGGGNGCGANGVAGGGGGGRSNSLRTGGAETRAGGGGGGGQSGNSGGGSGSSGANTGGGGDGGSTTRGNSGGNSGIVIVRYEIAPN